MAKYKKKPVVINAVIWDGSMKSTKEVLEFMGQEVDTSNEMTNHKFDDYCNIVCDNGFPIETLEGKMRASKGDYIIKGVNGEFYPCKPDIFEKTYELVGY